LSDPFIDQIETQIYGKYSRQQMAKVCLGRIPELDGMVNYAIATQEQADADMKAMLDKQPKLATIADAAAVLTEARDTIARFSNYLGSLKGHPVSPKAFFRNENPSDVARKRLVKLAGVIEHIVLEIPKHPAITDPTWLADFTSSLAKLEILKNAQQDTKVDKVDFGPEVAAQRLKWLATYGANKHLIRGLFAHLDKPDLLPLIFDDLAEIHHATGVSDEVPATPPAKADDGAAEAKADKAATPA
jgi:hypothetical protein